ncbi:Fructosamine/Ketosamine-3-kinase [Dendryphion nanum]|uniref:protein-ribulosamine 3-kinase n=1 Tax=Dendryphion nanum TaxID=256645 RepID=A0A9P9EL32_9PLEO|nr:Fructosamine/Ketosamine-3-kinase [Dendryphion nanum]
MATHLAHVHRMSRGKSPTGQFGFDVPAHPANMDVEEGGGCEDRWEGWFAKMLRGVFRFEQKSQDCRDEEFERRFGVLCERVVPRLLGPLESEGRKIEPCLVHTDLWPGNVRVDSKGEIVVFDPCVFWGHGEMDLGTWVHPRSVVASGFVEVYSGLMGVSEPVEELGDRVALYALRYELLLSGMYPGMRRKEWGS